MEIAIITSSVLATEDKSVSTQLLLVIENTAYKLVSFLISVEGVTISGIAFSVVLISASVHPLKEKPDGGVTTGRSPITSPLAIVFVCNKLPFS